LALVDTRIVAVLEAVAMSGDAAADKAWAEIYAAVELRRRLADTERKRMKTLRASIPAEEAMALIAALAASVKRQIHDRVIRAAITADIERVLETGPQGGRSRRGGWSALGPPPTSARQSRQLSRTTRDAALQGTVPR
jgi:hypothetical protein